MDAMRPQTERSNTMSTTTTFSEVLGAHNITIPDDTLAELEVPVLSGPQRQGDVGIFPREPMTPGERALAVDVPAAGVQVVVGEATGNTHLLHAEGTVRWLPKGGGGVLLGVIEVAEGSTGYLIHTDEHGANGLAPGCYRVHGKREQADEIRRVQD